MMMDAEKAREFLLSCSHATEETPFGPDVLVYKIGGKMFATLSFEGFTGRMNLKCDPDRALDLRAEHECILPGYHMNKRHWNTLVLDGSLPPAMIAELILHSHQLVYEKLPAKTRSSLGI